MTAEDLASRIASALSADGGRQIVAVAGPPASGKSTVAESLADKLVATGRSAVLVPMDGFHLDNRLLDARGLRSKKGAPETFDHAGFTHLIKRISAGEDAVAPVFDRKLDLAIAGAEVIPGAAEIVVVEGNYLLLDEPEWRDLSAFWTFKVFLDVPEPVLEDRLVRRWLDHGHDAKTARERALSNDIPNARRILRKRLPADLVLTE